MRDSCTNQGFCNDTTLRPVLLFPDIPFKNNCAVAEMCELAAQSNSITEEPVVGQVGGHLVQCINQLRCSTVGTQGQIVPGMPSAKKHVCHQSWGCQQDRVQGTGSHQSVIFIWSGKLRSSGSTHCSRMCGEVVPGTTCLSANQVNGNPVACCGSIEYLPTFYDYLLICNRHLICGKSESMVRAVSFVLVKYFSFSNILQKETS